MKDTDQIDQIVSEIQKVLDYFAQKDVYSGYDGDTMSAGGIKLSILKTTLSTMVADLEQEYELAELAYGLEEADKYLAIRNSAGKTSIDDAKMMIKGEMGEAKKALIKQKGNISKLRAYVRGVEGTVTNLQSRVSLLRHERNEQQLSK